MPQSWIDEFEKEIEKANELELEMIIMGDINIDFTGGCLNNKWENLLLTQSIVQLIDTPTRITSTSSTIIDHVYTNHPENIVETNVPKIALSDHYPVCITRKINQKDVPSLQHKQIRYRCFKNFNENKFLEDLNKTNFAQIEQISDIQSATDMWYKLFLSVINRHAPVKVKRIKHIRQPDWLTDEIKDAQNKRNYYQSKRDWEKFRYWRNKCTKLIEKSKQSFFKQAIENNKKPKEIWALLKDLKPKTQNEIPSTMNFDNKEYDNVQDIVNHFNTHFTTIGDKYVTNNTQYQANKLNDYVQDKIPAGVRFTIPFIKLDETKKLLSKLETSKATGLDEVGPFFIKLSSEALAPSITYLINLSILEGVFPENLKLAKVTPIFKNGDKHMPENYRPISILPTLSKIFEKHVAKHFYLYLSKYKVLHEAQSGFRSNHSCQTALTKLIDTWLKCIDNGNVVGTVFLDFKKRHLISLITPFSAINYIYTKSLNHSIKWFESYLSNRKQKVCSGNTASESKCIKYGVPQGSI
ncbi:Hypothetical predicted protein [Mytilus galloprovincialis]|uniref:Reverse transcriptase domain-containing protein n=1 Tax=Mytilus galloprovincialis TaxID=29158 RepID=A0A8B6H415_MYTGA|nr:Hypothetical predicted protein [Mytilus galloprovincialis]